MWVCLRSSVISVALGIAAAGAAHADTLTLSRDQPAAGLPALAHDGSGYVRPVRVQPAGCQGSQVFVEVGAQARGARGELLIVRDDCGKATATTLERNLASVNKTLRAGKYRSVGRAVGRALPAELDLDGRKVSVTAGQGGQVTVAAGRGDRWTVKLDGEVVELRGWYAGRAADGRTVLAIAVATRAKDTGARGRERWLDFWPAETAVAAIEEGSPAYVATQLVAALEKQDARELQALLSAPFWKVGLSPVTGTAAKSCRKLQSVKRDAQLARMASCIVAASRMYGRLRGKATISEIGLREFPEELKKHRSKVARLVRGEHKLARYHVNDGGFYVHLVVVLDPETNYQTASALLEFVEVD
jgi:hypothetical protein